MVSNLIEEGLVEEVGYGESMGGKAPILLEIVADSRYLVGLNLVMDGMESMHCNWFIRSWIAWLKMSGIRSSVLELVLRV
jgi:hypothetical protein